MSQNTRIFLRLKSFTLLVAMLFAILPGSACTSQGRQPTTADERIYIVGVQHVWLFSYRSESSPVTMNVTLEFLGRHVWRRSLQCLTTECTEARLVMAGDDVAALMQELRKLGKALIFPERMRPVMTACGEKKNSWTSYHVPRFMPCCAATQNQVGAQKYIHLESQ